MNVFTRAAEAGRCRQEPERVWHGRQRDRSIGAGLDFGRELQRIDETVLGLPLDAAQLASLIENIDEGSNGPTDPDRSAKRINNVSGPRPDTCAARMIDKQIIP